MKINKMILSLSLSFSLLSASEKSVYDFFVSKNIDMTTKSYLGWVRVLNDEQKRKEYKVDDLNKNEVTIYVAQLKELSKNNSSTFEGKLK